VVAGVDASYEISVEILPHDGSGGVRRHTGENFDAGFLKERVRTGPKTSRHHEIDASFVQPRRQESRLVFGRLYFGACRDLFRQRVHIDQCKLLTVAEVGG
jgi:hypothetical protein